MQLNFRAIRRAMHNTTVAALALFLSCAVAPVRGDNLQDPTSGEMVLFPGPLLEHTLTSKDRFGNAAMSKPVVMGWNIPGKSFRAGGGWWSLVCDTVGADERVSHYGAQCRLSSEPASLR